MPALPVHAPFDIYSVHAGSEMAAVLTYTGVSTQGNGGQFNTDGPTSDLIIGSGGTYDLLDASVAFNVAVPEAWTFEFNIKGSHLPPNFSGIIDSHIFLGSSDNNGVCAGVFLSKAGLAYTGAVHIDGSGDMVLDTPVQPLPDSSLLVEEGSYWTYRIATDVITRTTYIFITRTSDLVTTGHQLRYVLPAIQSSSATDAPVDRSFVSVRGTAGAESELFLDTISLGTGLIIPNIPPHADAGNDQAVRMCNVVQLDGSRSFDPEGAQLTYKWQLLDTPLGSQYIFDGLDGLTYPLPSPTGFTDKFHSLSLQDLNTHDPLSAGDVLIVQGLPYTISGTGSDGHGFYVSIVNSSLPDNLNVAFKLTRQRGISQSETVKPTFLPDVPGLYRFDLVVFDGDLFSESSEVIVNVTESPLPRGVIPDLKFLWGYLSDFWKLLEDRERLEVFWSGIAQIAAAELLNLWQIEYSKSLRDIQRTWQRKWLRYVLSMLEDPVLLEESVVRSILSGVESSNIPTAGVSGLDGLFLDVAIAGGGTFRIVISGAGSLSADNIANQIAGQLQAASMLFTVTQVPTQDGTNKRIRINAPFSFTLLVTSTLSLFTAGDKNGLLQGTGGTLSTMRSYKVERSLQGMGIKEGDFLVLDSTAYRIIRLTSDPSDQFPFQRITTLDDIPVGNPSAVWSIPGQATSQTLDFWGGLVSEGDRVVFEVIQKSDGQIAYVNSTALGASKYVTETLGVDTTDVARFVSQPDLFDVFLTSIIRRRYTPIDPLVVDVPYLQEIINNKDDSQILRRNVDFYIDTFRGDPCIRFIVGTNDVWQGADPPDHLWAETTYLDNRPTIEANFGVPAAFTLDDLSQLPSNVDYLSTVRGLWFAYLNGPTVFNLRVGTQILLGLPFAEETGIISEIRNDFSSTNGRILVRDASNEEIVRSYTYPAPLGVEINPSTGKAYVIGDTVTQFAPLVQGVEVVDYVKQKDWFVGYMAQGNFYEVEKFFKFLVKTDSSAFNLNALLFVQSFIQRIKPTYTFPIFVVAENLPVTEIDVQESTTFSGLLTLFDGPCFHGPPFNVAGMWDQPHAAGGGWRNRYDAQADTNPTFPTTTGPVLWAHDGESHCPEHPAVAILSLSWPGGTPSFDEFFISGQPIFSGSEAIFSASGIEYIFATPGFSFGEVMSTVSSTVDTVYLEIGGDNPTAVDPFTLEIWQNGSLVSTNTFSKGAGREYFQFTVSLPVAIGDTLEARIYTPSADLETRWHDAAVVLGNAVTWSTSTTLAAGIYNRYRSL
jgi:hypothetical protein